MMTLSEELEGLDPSSQVSYLVRLMFYLTIEARESYLVAGGAGGTSANPCVPSGFNEMTHLVSGQALAVIRGSKGYPWVDFFEIMEERGTKAGYGDGVQKALDRARSNR